MNDTRQLHLRRSKREQKERRFMRPDNGPASAWVDAPTTITEENPKIPRIVGGNIWFATPILNDGKERAIESGVVRAVKPLFHEKMSFNERMNAVGLPGDDDDDDATLEMSITHSEEMANLKRYNKERSTMGRDKEPWEMRW
jgi:hypothetical protein